jgi:hypothetical protein
MLTFFLLLPLGLYAQDNKSPLCSEFQRYLNQSADLTSYAVEEKEIQQDEFNFTIPNIDVDGDKLEDKILLFRGGSASIIPPDNDSVTLILSSTGEKFTVEMQRFFIIFYQSKYYIVATNWQGEKGPIFKDIKIMDRKGITEICSYKCGLKDGSCVPRQYHKEK